MWSETGRDSSVSPAAILQERRKPSSEIPAATHPCAATAAAAGPGVWEETAPSARQDCRHFLRGSVLMTFYDDSEPRACALLFFFFLPLHSILHTPEVSFTP